MTSDSYGWFRQLPQDFPRCDEDKTRDTLEGNVFLHCGEEQIVHNNGHYKIDIKCRHRDFCDQGCRISKAFYTALALIAAALVLLMALGGILSCYYHRYRARKQGGESGHKKNPHGWQGADTSPPGLHPPIMTASTVNE